jgi:hypothetical protein
MLLAVSAFGLSVTSANAESPAPPPAAAPSAAPSAEPAPSRAPTRRKCTGWAAGFTTETRDVVFRRDKLVQRATEEVEITYQAWDVDDALDAAGADAACRAKTRAFCERYRAPGDRCRFQVHEGLESDGWGAAAIVDAPPPKKATKRPKPAKASKPSKSTPPAQGPGASVKTP